MLCFVLINSVILNLLCVWIAALHTSHSCVPSVFGPFVCLQGAKLGKSLLANFTHVGSQAGVAHLVCLQEVSPGKLLTAHITKEGVITSVGPLMVLQMTHLSKSPPAHITKKRSVTSMNPLVSL